MKNTLLYIFTISSFFLYSQSVTNVSPDIGDIGQVVPVSITGTNFNLAIPQAFIFHQGSETLSTSNLQIASNTSANLDINIIQTGTYTLSGFFDLTFNYLQGSYYYNTELLDAFFVNPTLNGTNTVSGNILSGTPKQQSGNPIVFAKIFLKDVNTNAIIQVKRTDANGFIEFLNVPNGTYYLHIDDYNNTNPLELVVNENTNTSNLSLVLKNDNIVNGIQDEFFAKKYNFNIYPTVFSEELKITLNLNTVETITIIIYNSKGEIINSLIREDEKGTIEILLSNEFISVSNGIYFVETQVSSEKKIVKVIKK